MTDLVEFLEFLRARLDEDEQAARDAAYSSGGDGWRYYDLETTEKGRRYGGLKLGDEDIQTDDRFDGHQMFHIARHDPARVLREVEAKRRIIEEHADDGGYCRRCTVEDRSENTLEEIRNDGPYMITVHRPLLYPCPTLRLLALPFADHPDYDESWRP